MLGVQLSSFLAFWSVLYLCVLLQSKNGPFDIFERFRNIFAIRLMGDELVVDPNLLSEREWLGKTQMSLGGMFECHFCLSTWVSLLVYFLVWGFNSHDLVGAGMIVMTLSYTTSIFNATFEHILK